MGGTNCAPRLLSRARNLDGIAGLMVLNLKAQKFVHGGNGVGVFRRDADARLGPCFRACIGSPGAAASWSPRPGDFARGSGHARGSLQSREARERAWGDRPTAWRGDAQYPRAARFLLPWRFSRTGTPCRTTGSHFSSLGFEHTRALV